MSIKAIGFVGIGLFLSFFCALGKESSPFFSTDRNILAHQLFPQFLIVERVGGLSATALSGVVGVDGFLAQHGSQLLAGGWLLTAQEDGSIHVADDGIRIILIDRLELTLRLQHQTGRDLTASDLSLIHISQLQIAMMMSSSREMFCTSTA